MASNDSSNHNQRQQDTERSAVNFKSSRAVCLSCTPVLPGGWTAQLSLGCRGLLAPHASQSAAQHSTAHRHVQKGQACWGCAEAIQQAHCC
jgi:hypothetical protein